jgi:hypothetical protein
MPNKNNIFPFFSLKKTMEKRKAEKALVES